MLTFNTVMTDVAQSGAAAKRKHSITQAIVAANYEGYIKAVLVDLWKREVT